MKNSNVKLFITFSAGILFSALTVFAATITVNTDFTDNAVQYLQNIVLTDSSGSSGVVLDGNAQKIQVDNICDTAGTNCKVTANLLTNETDPLFASHSGDYYSKSASDAKYLTSYVDTNTQLTEGQVDAFADNNGYQTTGASINVNDGNTITVGTLSPESAQSIATAGAIRIGDTSRDEGGTIRYNGNRFEGYNGTSRLNLGAGGGSETDPHFAAFEGSGIRISDINNWNNKLSSYNELWNTGTNYSINYNEGKIGIGTTNPSSKLDVHGIIKIGNELSNCSGESDGGKLRYIDGGWDCGGGQTGTPGAALEICIALENTGTREIIKGTEPIACHDVQN